jgi:hypothetical protein
VYTGTYTSASGCDSIITLNLALNYINLLTILNGITITTNAPGLLYQWIDCATNTIISGATDQSYTATANGSYAVIVNGGGGCFDTSACTIINTVGLQQINQTKWVSVYPNPNKGFCTIELRVDAEMILTNALGEMLISKKVSKGKQILDLSSQADGIYFLKIKYETGYEIEKVIKQKE